MADALHAAMSKERPGKVKCLVWDLDGTLWDGTLLEDRDVTLRPGVRNIVAGLDDRGILQSIASRNDANQAYQKLEQLKLRQYFLYPQINWNTKTASIKTIAESLNIGIDSVAFIDDQAFERDEVKFSLPEVLTIDAVDLGSLLTMPALKPRFVTADSRRRRHMYLGEIDRTAAEAQFTGSSEEFLATLNMVFIISPASEDDLQRAEELTVRTNQLNATGYTYSYEELDQFRRSRDHDLLICSLEDRYGSYGNIGLALVKRDPAGWLIRLLLMSCRVMSRGVGGILLNHIMARAKVHGVRLLAEFVPTDRNRMMYITYRLAGFSDVDKENGVLVLAADLAKTRPYPKYVTVIAAQETTAVA
jgi:FkbH-like protein